ncbi:MAG: hypothetical protein HN390_07660 [Anaerolineae bacterium]|jgi:hypothetical protein|nr:hypothetical protein [Anaerolineae bacterium]MBT7191636.1 hypothetical protein [Anaerolineae bacterium]MBT7991901.1 hypothetical protein [Anaerolineae bacterium]
MNESNAHKLVFILILAFMIQACSPDVPTPSTSKPKNISDEAKSEYFALINPLLDEWEAVIPLMSDRGNGWLDRIIKLQEIRNEYSQLEIDPYFNELHTQMILHMDCQIAAYVALISSRDYSSIEFQGEPFELLEEPEVIFERCSFPGAE